MKIEDSSKDQNGIRAGRTDGVMGWRRRIAVPALMLLVLAGGYFRLSGLDRGLDAGVVFHPDTPKQILMLSNFLKGQYVQYFDSLFYDGYPYGLNRVDEVLLRPRIAARRGLDRWLRPETPPEGPPDRAELYRWARRLRVLYGGVTIVLIYAAVRRFGLRRWNAWLAAAVYAFAPLAATVTHSASGDVGLDLFLALAIWCMAGYVQRDGSAWILFAGMACGMAFACKYQGAMGLWIVGLPPLLNLFPLRGCFRDAIRRQGVSPAAGHLSRDMRPAAAAGTHRSYAPGRSGWSKLWVQGAAALVGFGAGVLLLTPAFFVNFNRTWKDMRDNFAFIRHYGAPPGWLDLALRHRIVHGLTRNLPMVLEALGWTLTVVTVLSAVWLVLRWRRAGRRPLRPTDPSAPIAVAARCRASIAAIATFPLMALVMSTAFKPVVQPFHFSFLLPFMAGSAAVWVDAVRRSGRVWLHGIVTGLVLLVLAESLAVGLREDFFWRRGETNVAAHRFAQGVFRQPHAPRHRYRIDTALKHFHAEPSRLPVFRNRSAGIHHPEREWWHRHHRLPVPSLPLEDDSGWIFVNGPVFPRNDRMFGVPAPDETRMLRRTLVFEDPPERFAVGLRTGRLPARYEIRTSGHRMRGFLVPQSQIVLEVRDVRPVRASVDASGRRAFLVPLRIRTRLGPLWVTILDRESERNHFHAHGPGPFAAPRVDPDAWTVETLQQRLEDLRYLDLDTSRPAWLSEVPVRLLTPDVPLAAGAYRFEAHVFNPGPAQNLRIELRDLSGFPSGVAPFDGRLGPGVHHVEWTFQKAFCPYNAPLKASVDGAGMHVYAWGLRPDPEGLVAWWRAPPPAPPAIMEDLPDWRPLEIVFPRLGVWRGIAIPGTLAPGEPFRYAVRFDLDPAIDHATFHEAVMFLHVRHADGHRIMTLDYPLRKAGMASDRIPWRHAVWPDDVSGAYGLEAGIYNVRTRRRFRFLPGAQADMDPRRRTFRVFDGAGARTEPHRPGTD